MPTLHSPSPDTAIVRSHTASTSERSRESRSRSPKRHGKLWRDSQHWTRWLHVYAGMISLLVVLFFGATGVTLNHPEWTLGLDPVTETHAGTLPDGWTTDEQAVSYLTISEYLRDTYDVSGHVSAFGSDASEGYISYRGPGYAADVAFDVVTGDYQLTVEQQGLIGVLNDLHKGRDSGSAWSWLIDASGIFLVVVALTGLGLQLFLSKRRKIALTVAGVGAVIMLLLFAIAVS